MLPLHTCQTINPLKKPRYIVGKHGSVWKLIEKCRHKINTCLLIKPIRIVLLLILFQGHSPSIYFSHLLSHPHKKPISCVIWPMLTLLFTLANNEYRKYSDDCGCNSYSQLNMCWTSVFLFLTCFVFLFTYAQTIYLLCFVFLEAEGKENFVQHLALMCSSLALRLCLQVLTNPPHHMNRVEMLGCQGLFRWPQLYAALSSPWAGLWKKDDLCHFASNKRDLLLFCTSQNRKSMFAGSLNTTHCASICTLGTFHKT